MVLDNSGGDDGGDNQKISAKNIQTHVEAVHFDGRLDRTKRDLLRQLTQPIFATQNIGEVIQRAQQVRQQFADLGLFRSVQVSIEESREQPTANNNDLSKIAVIFDVEETRRYAGGIYTSASNNEASLILELRSPNLLGRGEELQGRFEHSWKYFSSWSTSFTKPLLKTFWPSIDSRLDLTVLQSARDAPWSGFKQLDRGFFANLNIQNSRYSHNSFRWESCWRYLSSADLATSFKIREQLGHSLKSSVTHVFTHDRRDSAILPTRGFMFQLLNEYAGFHKESGVSFRRHEVEVQHNVSILKLILQGSLKFGVLKPYDNVLVTDRLFLGGPLNLRGFQMNGVGPHNNRCALGANTYWVSGLHAYLPLPFKNNLNECLRIHGWVNAGNISDTVSRDLVTKDVRLSTGLGLMMNFGSKVRLEINYCLPLRAGPEDKSAPGLQFGVGINYT